jgi:DNA polymerase-1
MKSWDCETTITTSFKRKANPFDAANWVVTHAWKTPDAANDAVIEHRFGSDRPPAGWLKPVLDGCKLLAGFNIKFDILHALNDKDNLEAWMAWVADGGQVWDCQLAEYLLCGMSQADQMLSMDDTAPRYGGNVKFDEIKALWEAGVNTHEIEPLLLTRYLCGGEDEHGTFQLGDIGNTEKIALAQIKRARAAGQLRSIMLNMGSLLCTIEMERNGMFIDMPVGLVLAKELEAEIKNLKEALHQYLPSNLPFEFNWSSRFHKSALIFGGPIKYERREYQKIDGTYTFDDKHPEQAFANKTERHYLLDDGCTMECSWWEHLRDTEWNGEIPGGKDRITNKGGKNAGEPKTKLVTVEDLTKPKSRMGVDIFRFPQITQPKKSWESSDPGVYSVSEDVIEELGNRNIPFLKNLARLAKLVKDLGTYFITTDEKTGKTKGMLSLVGLDGIVHHKLNHTSTVTGRFSSSEPNLQNIPKGDKSKVKTIFTSRFGPDGVVIQSDFTSLEIYIQAILTRCRQLIEDLRKGLDMHVLRLSNSPAGEGKAYEELLKLAKGYMRDGVKVEAEEKWHYARTDSKVYSFQAAYGAGDEKIAETTGMPVERVADLRAADNKRYPEIEEYFAKRTVEIQGNRRDGGGAVPHPDVPGVFCRLGVAQVRTPDGKLYTYREYPAPEWQVKRGKFASFMPTEIKNYEVQGEGGEWAKAAMWLAVREFYRRRNWQGLGLLVNQVHDANYADAHKTVSLEVAAVLHACMEAASDFMEWYFKWPVPVPVPSETTAGRSMADDISIPGLKDLAREIRLDLRRRYMDGYVPSYERQA